MQEPGRQPRGLPRTSEKVPGRPRGEEGVRTVRAALRLPSTNQGRQIGLLGATAMAGTIGGGGVGDLALTYGYQRFNNTLMFVTVIILIIIVQSIQLFGNWIAARIRENN